eukprot:5584403-Pyramimonas_sp.AAC.1
MLRHVLHSAKSLVVPSGGKSSGIPKGVTNIARPSGHDPQWAPIAEGEREYTRSEYQLRKARDKREYTRSGHQSRKARKNIPTVGTNFGRQERLFVTKVSRINKYSTHLRPRPCGRQRPHQVGGSPHGAECHLPAPGRVHQKPAVRWGARWEGLRVVRAETVNRHKPPEHAEKRRNRTNK